MQETSLLGSRRTRDQRLASAQKNSAGTGVSSAMQQASPIPRRIVIWSLRSRNSDSAEVMTDNKASSCGPGRKVAAMAFIVLSSA